MPFFINGPAGKLEAQLTPTEHSNAPLVIICHPHPQHGGTMTNKVVTTTARAMQKLGAATLLFNVRGVGQSDGDFDNQVGEIDDALAVLDWAIAHKHPNQAVWIAGFSFGAFLAASVANQRPKIIQQLLTLAPVLSHSDYTQLTHISCPWHAIIGDNDDFVSVNELHTFQQNHPIPMTLHIMDEACHYFHGKLIPLREHVVSHYHSDENDSQQP